ncbi:hypothetical protein Tco_1275830 [Tanacetum coccineum]
MWLLIYDIQAGLSYGYEQIDFALMVKEGFDIQACTTGKRCNRCESSAGQVCESMLLALSDVGQQTHLDLGWNCAQCSHLLSLSMCLIEDEVFVKRLR